MEFPIGGAIGRQSATLPSVQLAPSIDAKLWRLLYFRLVAHDASIPPFRPKPTQIAMKSERRHELQQNDLAIYLNKVNQSIEPYSRLIAIGVAVLIVGGISWGLYNSQQTGKRSDATLQLIQASSTQDAEDLLTVSESYPETAAGAWARLYQGKQYLSEGVQALYSNRTNAEQLLEDAQAAFENALARSNDRLLVSRAHFGIARAAESLGNLEEAIAAYEEVIAVNESEAMVEMAERRIEILNNPDTKDFLAWFADQDFAPADPSMPPSLPGADSLPELPDLSLPDLSLDSVGDPEPRNIEGGIELPEGGSDSEPTDDTTEEPGNTLELPEEEPAPADSTEAEAATEDDAAEQPAADGSTRDA